MKRVIIGIHGLGNKPAADVLHRWWRRSLYEGFRAIGHPRRRLPFETVYWADILHRIPYDPAIRDRGDARYLEEPYRPSPGGPVPSSRPVRKKILDLVEKQIMRLDPDEGSSLLWKQLNDLVLRRFFVELEAYYTNSLEIAPGAALAYRDIVRTRLANKLREHSSKEILLIAHSMGSIIAYDVLSSAPPGVQVHTLITIGSPLGMPLIMHNIRLEQKLAPGESSLHRRPSPITGTISPILPTRWPSTTSLPTISFPIPVGWGSPTSRSLTTMPSMAIPIPTRPTAICAPRSWRASVSISSAPGRVPPPSAAMMPSSRPGSGGAAFSAPPESPSCFLESPCRCPWG